NPAGKLVVATDPEGKLVRLTSPGDGAINTRVLDLARTIEEVARQPDNDAMVFKSPEAVKGQELSIPAKRISLHLPDQMDVDFTNCQGNGGFVEATGGQRCTYRIGSGTKAGIKVKEGGNIISALPPANVSIDRLYEPDPAKQKLPTMYLRYTSGAVLTVE